MRIIYTLHEARVVCSSYFRVEQAQKKWPISNNTHNSFLDGLASFLIAIESMKY